MKGRGTGLQPNNRFASQERGNYHEEGIDEQLLQERVPTEYIVEHPKTVMSKNDSPDIPFTYSINPYQGCEHGCIYCYARNSHEYWGYNMGLDFERKIVVKPDAPRLLEKSFLSPSWKPQVIMLSGNTDCYQPAEKKYGITRELLKVFQKYGNPLGIITKNALIERDLDVLSDLASENLVHVIFTITSLDEELRRVLEPRTSHPLKKLKVMEKLTQRGIPCGVMMGPIIPGLNNTEIPRILKLSSEYGALTSTFTLVRLNGQLGTLFREWLETHFPDRAAKVWNQICSIHDGQVNDSEFGRRMRGEGPLAESIHAMFSKMQDKYFKDKKMPDYDFTRFRRKGVLNLF
ncbi:MAG: PA0069 family radical SAM protein [Imperialibacter sp.]|uniref:PA0069 family radical SAM protein n=1 Tax=Imperialibacter sp. TaxID=2038411 RepID=UPI0032EB278B